jgi:peptidoglycan/xylan/chitin deacetylase (PgdA/CDA1 family)
MRGPLDGSPGQVIVVCYHAVSDDWPEAGAVRPRHLEQQLRWLVDQGFVGVTFQEAVATPPAGKSVAVTFDDGYRSVLENGFPILSRLRLPATLFVATGFVDSQSSLVWPGLDRWFGGPHHGELTPLSWSELQELSGSGWEVGSHTRTHPNLTRLDDIALRAELELSRNACEERLGLPCRSLAYPYGAVDERVLRAAREVGYGAAGLLSWRLPPPTALAWPRIGIFRSDGYVGFRLKISTVGRRLREPTAWGAIQPVADRLRRRFR